MRGQHREVFFVVAERLTCWIGLREPNPLADKWIGQPGCIPKPEPCKAKTADNPAFRLAGLVVDPTRCPQGFGPASLAAATATWKNSFLRGGRLPDGYTCVEHGPEKGLVKLRGSSIFADFDLMTVVRSNDNGDFLFEELQDSTQKLKVEIEQLSRDVQRELNRRLRVPMIQHGPEMLFLGGVGGREFEYVLWFGPGHRFYCWPSSMPSPKRGEAPH